MANLDHAGGTDRARAGSADDHCRSDGWRHFLAYLEQVLCPRLRPGQVVIMDNLSVHQVAGVRERIEAVGARLLYLPPYSPDFNPIEPAWSKVKQILRSLKARTADALEAAVAEALAAITPENAIAWFSHCGYSLH